MQPRIIVKIARLLLAFSITVALLLPAIDCAKGESARTVLIKITQEIDGWHVTFGEPTMPVSLSEINMRYYTPYSGFGSQFNLYTLEELTALDNSTIYVKYVQINEGASNLTQGDYLWLNSNYFFNNDTIWLNNIHSDRISYPWIYLINDTLMVISLDPNINYNNRLADYYGMIGGIVFICGASQFAVGVPILLLKRKTAYDRWLLALCLASILMMLFGGALHFISMTSYYT
ncbi:MAG: hypothetical protein V1934_08250 [Methanobacteriota archaeon]